MDPRQAMQPAAFISHSRVKAATVDDLLHVVAISHSWLQADHPDPRGHNLRNLGRVLQLMSRDPSLSIEFSGVWAVFMDFCCIHQCCRDSDGAPQLRTFRWLDESQCFAEGAIGRFEREDALFKEALESLGSFYSHRATVVFMMTKFPADYDDPEKYTRSGNTETYFNRGWCYCESSWAMLTKGSHHLVDLGKQSGK
ncbi:unnamed protein product, partial [Prorocentrum cordatum]